MGDTIKVYDFGSGGVNTDDTPVLMKDNELRQAQNAIHHDHGTRGAMIKRLGLARFNLTRMLGSILGGIEMPVADTGGAPASGGGGGGTGSPIPNTNSDPIGPGYSIDPSVNAGGSTPPGPDLGQGNHLFGGARLLLLGLEDTSVGTTQNGHGWFVTSRLAADSALWSITGTNGAIVGPPGHPTDVIRPGGTDYYVHGQNPYTYANGVLFYGEAFVQAAANPPTNKARLRRYDGVTDELIYTFPNNELTVGGSYRTSVVNVIVEYGNGNTLYVALADAIATGAGATGYAGRIFKVSGLDARNYAVTEIFNSLYAGNGVGFVSHKDTNPYAPYSMEFFGGKLWVGMWRGHIALDADFDPYIFKLDAVSGVPPLVPQQTTGIEDHSTNGASDITVLKRFNGSLYIGVREAYNKTGGFTPGFMKVYKLDPDQTLTAIYDLDTDFANAAAAGNGTFSMSVFNDALYISCWNSTAGDGVKILKTTDGTNFSVVLTVSNSTGPLNLGQDDGVLYAWGRVGASANGLYYTEDGTTWSSDKGANLPVGGSAKYNPMNFIYGVNQ